MKTITTAIPKDFDQWMKGQGPKGGQPAPTPAPTKKPDPEVIKKAVESWLDTIRKGDDKAQDDADRLILDTMVEQGVMTQAERDMAYVEHGAEEHDLVHIFVVPDSGDTIIYEADLNGNAGKF